MDWTLFLVILMPITSIIVAGILAYKKIEGWGWFLLIALVLASGLKIHRNKF